MFRSDVQFLCHPIAVVGEKIIVQGFAVACDRPADRSGMCGKHGGYFGNMLLDIQRSHTRHPFVGMEDDIGKLRQIEAIKTFRHFSRSDCKHARFVIISVSVQRVHLKIFPHPGIDRILLDKKRTEIDQKDHRIPRNIPLSRPDF